MKFELIRRVSLSALISMPIVACGGEKGADETTSKTDQAFTANWAYAWGTTEVSSTEIGTATGRTCFLTGVTGNLRPDGNYPYGSGTYSPAGAGVRVNAQGNYEIYVAPGRSGSPVEAFARCANPASVTPEVSWQAGQGWVWLAGVKAGRTCALTSVTNVMQCDDNGVCYWGFAADSDAVQVTSDVYNWYLTGHAGDGSLNYNGTMHATARCFDMNENDGSWEWIVGDGGSLFEPLSNSPGATCSLTGLAGNFQNNDYNDGVYITQPGGWFGSTFFMSLKNGKTGYSTCMK
jgi:hypothetical protein